MGGSDRERASTVKFSAMNSRERVLAATRREPVDYVPCIPMVNPLTEVQRCGQPWNFPWDPPGDGVEYMASVMGTDPVVSAWWMEGVYPEDTVSVRVWRKDDTLHKAYETPSGTLHSVVLASELWPFGDDIPFFHDFVAHYREPWLKTEEDLACLRHILLPPRTKDQLAEMQMHAKRAQSTANRLGLATVATIGSGLTSALWMFGAEQLCLLTLDDPDLVEGYLEIEHQWNLRMMELAMEWGVDIIRRNGFYESGDYYSPTMLDRFLGRRLRREVETVHQGGHAIAYTMYSGIMPILDHLAGIDFDCIAALDIAYDNVDLTKVVETLGDRKSFWTGPSNTFHMYEKPEHVRQAVRDVFTAFGRTGLAVMAASSIHPMMPWENTLAMIDEWRQWRDA